MIGIEIYSSCKTRSFIGWDLSNTFDRDWGMFERLEQIKKLIDIGLCLLSRDMEIRSGRYLGHWGFEVTDPRQST